MKPEHDSLPEAIRAALAASAEPALQTAGEAQPPCAEGPRSVGAAGLSDFDRAERYAAKVPGAGEGGRNNALNALAFRLLGLFRLTETELLDLCLSWCQRCAPPYPDREGRQTVSSAYKGASRKAAIGSRWEPSKAPRSGAVRSTGNAAESGSQQAGPVAAALPLDAIEAELVRIEALNGPERDQAAGELLDRAAPAIQRLPVLQSERLQERMRSVFGVGSRSFTRAMKQAQRRARGDEEEESGHADYQELARAFLQRRSFGEPGPDMRLRYLRQDWYRWTGHHWEMAADDDLRSDVTAFLQEEGQVAHRVSEALVGNVLRNLKGLARIVFDVAPPFWIETGMRAPRLVPMANGILDPGALFSGRGDTLIPCTPRLFNVYSLPCEYRPEATAPAFDTYFAEAVPDADVRRHLLEWFGLNLVYDTRYQKFLILIGKGGDGKSVFLAIMRALLGPAASAVNLSAFGAERSFNLVPTINMLANIYPDIDYTTSREEGLLKAYVSGEAITIEKKGKDPRTVIPTARLTFSCNQFPAFKDRSGGIWRRLYLAEFPNSVPEERQNPNMCTPEWWQAQGQLSGILNQALEGLKRLEARGRFCEPDACRALKGDYKSERNPASEFLDDHCCRCECFGNSDAQPTEENPCADHAVWTGDLYQAYRDWLKNGGYDAREVLTKAYFGREVRRLFPSVVLSRNPKTHRIYRQVHQGGLLIKTDEVEMEVRDRQWLGLEYHANGLPTPGVVHADQPAESPPIQELPL
jgi:P4 family phage/plasmid primase-like protien